MSVFASSPENDLGPSQHDDEEQAEATPHDSLLGHRTARRQDNKRLLLTAGPGLLLWFEAQILPRRRQLC